jgi:hypothetical protein
MMVLPPMGESDQDSVSDKVFLLRARQVEMPMPTGDAFERDAFWKTLISELPAFRHFLQTWKIPTELRCGRFGIKTWHHPVLLEALNSLAPETRLLALIDEVLFSDSGVGEDIIVKARKTPWIGTAEKLESRLFESTLGYEAKKLLGWAFATGTYLGRLQAKTNRVKKLRSSDSRDWGIVAPGDTISVFDEAA